MLIEHAVFNTFSSRLVDRRRGSVVLFSGRTAGASLQRSIFVSLAVWLRWLGRLGWLWWMIAGTGGARTIRWSPPLMKMHEMHEFAWAVWVARIWPEWFTRIRSLSIVDFEIWKPIFSGELRAYSAWRSRLFGGWLWFLGFGIFDCFNSLPMATTVTVDEPLTIRNYFCFFVTLLNSFAFFDFG